MKRRPLLALALFAATAATAGATASDEALWRLLEAGGQVVMMRHAITTDGFGDPPGMVLGDCSTQRNLTDEGRAHAGQVGDALRARGVVVTQVLSSPWCRCLETARLAFRTEPEVAGALANLFGRTDPQGRQVSAMKALVSRKPARGNIVLVSHGSAILPVTGISPAPAEMVVITPLGGGRFTVAGRLAVPAR